MPGVICACSATDPSCESSRDASRCLLTGWRGTLEAMSSTSSIADAIEPRILEILRCPVTGSALTQRGGALLAVADETIRYPIQHGVPKLLADAAEPEGKP